MGTLKLFAGSLIVLTLVSVIVFAMGLIFLGLESTPLVTLDRELKQEDIGRIKKIIQQNDPRRLKDGQVKKITIRQEELNLALDYALVSLDARMGARVALGVESAKIQMSMGLPGRLSGQYLNLATQLSFKGRSATIRRMKLGKLPVPVVLVNPAMALGYHLFKSTAWFQTVGEVIDSIRVIEPGDRQVSLEFQWDRGVAKRFQNQARDLILSPSDRNRIRFYSREIARLSRSFNKPALSLSAYFEPLFATALERSRAGEPPGPENRALVFSLALYAMNWSEKSLTGDPGAAVLPTAARRTLTLMGRSDLTQHFLISAAIAAGTNSGLSSIVGVFKEMEDSRGGTGFSFADLAADRAGIAFARLAVENDELARGLQVAMARVRRETEFMPPIDHLPEGIMELEFKHTYHDLNSREYALVEAEIARRIAGCKIHGQVGAP
jgi:hypothetical protein